MTEDAERTTIPAGPPQESIAGAPVGRVTIRDVARVAGVSVTTASRALRGTGELSDQRRADVLAAAQRLRYVPSTVARALVSGRTQTIGVIITDNASPVYAEVLHGIDSVAYAHNYGVIFCNSSDSQDIALKCVETLLARQVDGILLTPTQVDQRDLTTIQHAAIPMVCIARYFPHLPLDYVVGDNAGIGHTVTQHLLGLGHTRIAHITGPPGLSSLDERLEGYSRALRDHGVPLRDDYVVRTEHSISAGKEAARALLALPDPPTAIFAGLTRQALGVFPAADEAGRRIAEDLALVGGDETDYAELLKVPLTTFIHPAREIGSKGAEMLLRKLTAPRGSELPVEQLILPMTLVPRRSSLGTSRVSA